MSESTPPSPIIEERRPGIVTFVAVILYINAAMALFFGVFGYLQRGNADVQASLGLTEDQFLWWMILELIIGVFLLIVATGIMNGAGWARILVTIGMGFRLVQASLFATLGGTGGSVFLASVLYAIIPLIALWAVWGHEKGEAWFHQMTR